MSNFENQAMGKRLTSAEPSMTIEDAYETCRSDESEEKPLRIHRLVFTIFQRTTDRRHS